MAIVGLERGVRYERNGLELAIRKVLEPLGGIARFVHEGDRVLIKPNLVAPGSPNSGVCTHPLFVRAVCDIVAERNPARIHVGDLPGYNYLGQTRRCLDESGLAEALAGGPARIVHFEGAFDRIPGERFRTYRYIDLTREVTEADVVISLPKLKTHRLTSFTGAVKNIFGCVSYGTRERIHKIGDYREFCDGIVDIYGYIRPALTIADMVRVQEGNGPCTGTPLDVGIILASADGVAVDSVGQFLLGFKPGEVLTTVLAHERGLGEIDLDIIRVAGPEDWRESRVAARRPSRFYSWAYFRLPKPIFKPVAAFARVKPVFASKRCDLCGLCLENCPGQALSVEKKTVRRDTKACRLCFGCVLWCPRGAAVPRWDAVSIGSKLMSEKYLR
jgi:uncharacterized protein (DUF362 family)/Pyruvate/2-oxoacid:ferredoxin oxidoreductase delta subunit